MERMPDPPEYYGECGCRECVCWVEFGPSAKPYSKFDVCEDCANGNHLGAEPYDSED